MVDFPVTYVFNTTKCNIFVGNPYPHAWSLLYDTTCSVYVSHKNLYWFSINVGWKDYIIHCSGGISDH